MSATAYRPAILSSMEFVPPAASGPGAKATARLAAANGGGRRPPYAWGGISLEQWAALPVFVLMYFSPLRHDVIGIAALLGCALYRLDERRRRIVLVPITFSTLMLIGRVAASPAVPVYLQGAKPEQAVSWLPLFLAACIFYMPSVATMSNNFFFGMAGLVLLSGILPGDSWQTIFATAQIFLFMGLVVCLAIDFAQRPVPPQPREAAAAV